MGNPRHRLCAALFTLLPVLVGRAYGDEVFDRYQRNLRAGLNEKLMSAVFSDRTDEAKALLEKGADPNMVVSGVGGPLLALALIRAHPPTVRALLEHAADMNAKYGDSTPLYEALTGQNAEIAEMFLAKGANPDVVVKIALGTTPLMKASYAGDLARVKLLLRYGARADAKKGPAPGDEYSKDENYTALDYALLGKRPEVARELRAHLAGLKRKGAARRRPAETGSNLVQ